MKKLVLILLVLVSVTGYTLKAQDVYSDNKMSVAFFSSTPVEDIDAHSALGSAAMNVKTKQVFVTVAMKSFQFKKELMQEHFNENYVESDKYPDATFNGTIKD